MVSQSSSSPHMTNLDFAFLSSFLVCLEQSCDLRAECDLRAALGPDPLHGASGQQLGRSGVHVKELKDRQARCRRNKAGAQLKARSCGEIPGGQCPRQLSMRRGGVSQI